MNKLCPFLKVKTYVFDTSYTFEGVEVKNLAEEVESFNVCKKYECMAYDDCRDECKKIK